MKVNIWPTFLLILLGANVAVVAITMSLAGRDGGPAITPEYDARATRWDESRAAQARSDAIGWNCAATIRPGAGNSGEVRVTLVPRDDSVSAVSGVMLRVTLFHSAHPNHPVTVNMSTDELGVASAPIGFEHAGLYTVHVESAATRTRARFICDLEVMSNPPAGAVSLTPNAQ